jgi:hypothetical protein
MTTRSRGSKDSHSKCSQHVMEAKQSTEPAPTVRVRIKLTGMKSLGVLEAAITKLGISKKRPLSEVALKEDFTNRRRTRLSDGIQVGPPTRYIELDGDDAWPSAYHPGAHVAIPEQVAPLVLESTATPKNSNEHKDDLAVAIPLRRSARSSSRDTVVYCEEEMEILEEEAAKEGIPFILSTTNKLSAARLVSEYDRVCCSQHGACVSLKGFYSDDNSAKDAVHNLLQDCDEMNGKYKEAEEDEDFVAERQLHGRSLRTIQGRMNQEIIVRLHEKEQAELLAIELAYQWKGKKKPEPTMEELEWDEIQHRPVIFAAKNSRCRRTSGSTSCPCAARSSRGGSNTDQPTLCRLCCSPDDNINGKTSLIQNKNMVPLFRTIDVDAPDFVNRDDSEEDADDEAESAQETRRTRGSNRIRYDHRARQETALKLNELKHSIDFIEQYNAGLLQEKLRECRK